MTLTRLDPRVKLTVLLTLSTLCVLTDNPLTLLMLLAFATIFILLMGVSPIMMYKKARTALKLLVSLFILQTVFNRSGEPLLTIASLTLVTTGGVHMALVVALRLLMLMQSAIILTTGRTGDYLLALTAWHVPYEISFMLMAALKFLPGLRSEAQDVLCAVEMRGLDLKTLPPKRKIKTYLQVMTPIVARAIKKSEQLSIAMEARAFRAYKTRTTLKSLTFQKTDAGVLALSLFVLLLIFIGGM